MKTTNAGVDICSRQEPLPKLATTSRYPDLPRVFGRFNSKVLRFILVGGSSVLVDFMAFLFLSLFYAVFWAKLFSYLAGMVVGFFGNKFYTFKSRRRSWYEPITYTLLYAVTLCANVATCWCVHAALEKVVFALEDTLAFVVATGVSTVLNYLGMSLVTFRNSSSREGAEEANISESIAA